MRQPLSNGHTHSNRENSVPDEAEYARDRPWETEYGDIPDSALNAAPETTGLDELVRNASRLYADKPAFTCCLDNGLSGTLTYGEVDAHSDAFAAYLAHELGIAPGDRVAVQMPNCLAYPVAAFGVLKAGAVLVNVNPLYTAREMKHQLSDSGARCLVIIDLFADKLAEALERTRVGHVIRVGIADFFPFTRRALIHGMLRLRREVPRANVRTVTLRAALRAAGGGRPPALPTAAGGTERLAVLQYTGGTTGVAKGAELTHGNLLANLAQLRTVCHDRVRAGDEVVLTALPLYHIFAFTFNLLFFYRAGGHNVLCPSPRPVDKLRKAFQRHAVTKFSGVNTLFAGLLAADWFRDNPPRRLDLSIAGGTALQTRVAEDWESLLGSPVLEGYGLSETSPVLCVNPPKGERRLGTIGIPLPGTDVRVVDEEGRPLPAGEPGELVARGPQVMRGYANRPDETAQALRGGWFHTGDVAVMDERGYFRIVDRKKDMIDVSGFNVFPNEVEDVLATHPGVAEVAVVGLPGPGGGETVCAHVVGRPGAAPDADELISFARQRLTAYKVPKQVVFRDDLPKTPVGKILRKEVREDALNKR